MNRIILFDGDCSFCNQSVRFILKRDPKKVFQFTSLQSEVGQRLLKKYKVPITIDSLVYIEGDQCFIKSTAALQICKHLCHFWKLGFILLFIPRKIRDQAYDFIAQHRYRLKRKTTCPLPKKEDLHRFLS